MQNRNEILSEAKRLYDLGFAVHWIRPNSKAPVKTGWSSPVRDDWETVKSEYKDGYGLGVRMGESSNLGDGYLANIDVDIKSNDPRHEKEATDYLDRIFPGLREKAPIVKTSYGFRVFVKTSTPLGSGRITQSKDECVVYMPSAEITGRQKQGLASGKITEADLKAGKRLRAAWEIEFMSTGKQVVLPPSLHPETKKPYLWYRPIKGVLMIPTVRVDELRNRNLDGSEKSKQLEKQKDFEFVKLDALDLELRLPEKYSGMILEGLENEADRSSAFYGVLISMVKHKFSDEEIVSVLTDTEFPISEIAYRHRQTHSRKSAADWVLNQNLLKAKREVLAEFVFENEVNFSPILEDQALVEAQRLELVEVEDWKLKLERLGKNKDGALVKSLQNIDLILSNAVGENVFKRDIFSFRDIYGCKTPWGAKAGDLLCDDDVPKIKLWLGQHFRTEPSKGTIEDAMIVISCRNSFDPVLNWLDSLPAWDLTPRLDTWLLKNFEAEGEPEYLAQIFRKWLVAMVMRVYSPGAKFDWMPIFEGMQGVGKSSFGRLLVTDKYFIDWLPDLSDKDSALALQGIWGVELGELASLRRNEIEAVKAFVTRTIDKVRPPFGKRSIEAPRRCVFFGTTNADTYLRDASGNRRFRPVKVGKLDFKALEDERDQLFAEAIFLFKNSLETEKTLDTDGKAKEFELQIQSEKMVEDESDSMRDCILDFIEKKSTKNGEENGSEIGPNFDLSRFPLMGLFEVGGPLEKFHYNGRTSQLAAKALKSIGAKKWRANGRSYWKVKKE